ncbi:MAG: AbrB/MazE/SpoVT family DNA-binding domain-containing protein [Candidatus Nitrosocaldus sp.]
MEIKRRLGKKGQIVIPKIVREFLAIEPGDEVIIEIREGGEVVIRSRIDPVRFVDEFCSSNNKLGKMIDVERLIEEEGEERGYGYGRSI